MTKIEEQVLSIEQMQHLKELGLKVNEASHFWCSLCRDARGDKVEKRFWFIHLHAQIKTYGLTMFEIIPTLTLQEILELLPKYIETGCLNRNFRFKDSLADCLIWYEINSFEVPIVRYKGSTFLDAAYKTLCWVLENDYLNQ